MTQEASPSIYWQALQETSRRIDKLAQPIAEITDRKEETIDNLMLNVRLAKVHPQVASFEGHLSRLMDFNISLNSLNRTKAGFENSFLLMGLAAGIKSNAEESE